MKRLFFLLAIGVFLMGQHTGCKNSGKQGIDSTAMTITVDSFLATPEAWAGKDVIITGTVSHICKHSGKKLFLFSANEDKTVKIKAGGDHTTFDVKLQGSDVVVTGIVVEDEKIDANYLDEWEKEIKEMIADKDQKVCNEDGKAIKVQQGDTSCTHETVEDPYAPVKEFRKKLEESGKTYIPVYAIECKTLKELPKKQ
jgi:hypothetical protein